MIRQRVTAAFISASRGSSTERLRRSRKPRVPAASAARCNRRDAVSVTRAVVSATTASQASGSQALFHRSQHMPAGLKEDHALRRQTDASKRRREEVGAFLHPQDGALLARQYPGEKQRRSGTVLCLGISAGGFVQSALQPLARQKVVDRRQAEFQRGQAPACRVRRLQPGNLCPECVDLLCFA